ncbi:hypothetical protein HXY32_01135 [Candidatus Bathyarchaeota archaeon]|nr:hypothetical protein [Candidatus Bathyarchaeota archaeon]
MRIGTRDYPFLYYFRGIENVAVVRRIFGKKTEEILKNLRVEFTWIGGYMWINNFNGHLVISAKYLKEGDRTDIYLDLIHELVHVKQLMEGKELFDVHYSYTERPTEVEAYSVAVEEAKRIGLSDKRICRYLKTEWMSDEDLKRLAKALNVKCALE